LVQELIKVNALQVAPAELEAALLENDNVADAAVVGITLYVHITGLEPKRPKKLIWGANRDGNEWPRAYVVVQEASRGKVTPKDIQDWLAPRVAKHKRLVGGVVFIDEVPKLASGKIQRKTMREWAKRDAAELNKQKGAAKAKL
jgi:4-coumarate--CoA ligase